MFFFSFFNFFFLLTSTVTAKQSLLTNFTVMVDAAKTMLNEITIIQTCIGCMYCNTLIQANEQATDNKRRGKINVFMYIYVVNVYNMSTQHNTLWLHRQSFQLYVVQILTGTLGKTHFHIQWIETDSHTNTNEPVHMFDSKRIAVHRGSLRLS